MNHGPTLEPCHPWLHRFAVLLTVTTFPLIASGGTVTSTNVGMVDPTWTFSPFKLFTSEGLEELVSVGMLIEHSHRQIGWIVGLLAIVLAIWTLATQSGTRRWLGVWVLLAVCVQGALGAARIKLNEYPGFVASTMGRDIAMIHGVTGQLVLCLMALTAAMLAPRGTTSEMLGTPTPQKLQRLVIWTTLLMGLQLVVGVWLRHMGGQIYLWLHVFLGAAVAAHVILVFVKSRPIGSAMGRLPAVMLILLVVQVLLGVAAWWMGGGSGMMYITDKLTNERIVLTTAHQFCGALLLMSSVVTTFLGWQQVAEVKV